MSRTRPKPERILRTSWRIIADAAEFIDTYGPAAGPEARAEGNRIASELEDLSVTMRISATKPSQGGRRPR